VPWTRTISVAVVVDSDVAGGLAREELGVVETAEVAADAGEIVESRLTVSM
jgi:hypothetical protein